jgi:O-antigen/teichoic acid export membrane protein
MAGLRGRILSGATYGAVALVLGTMVNLGATPYFVRHLGKDGYSAFLLLSSCIAFANLLALGAHEAVLYYLAKPRDDAWQRSAEALAGLFTLGGALGAVIWALAWAGFPSWVAYSGHIEPVLALALSQGIGAAGLLWVAQHFTQASWAFYRARLRLAEVGWMMILTATLPVLAAAGAIYAGAGVNGFFLAQAAAWALVGLIAIGMAVRGPEALKVLPRWYKAELSESLGYARWAFFLQVGFTVQSYGDRFLAAPLGSAALSVYGLGSSLSLRIVAALGLVSTLVVPAISKVHAEHGMDRAGRAHGLALRSTFWVGAAFFVPLAAGGSTLLGRWVDPSMEAGSQGWFIWVCVGGFWAALVGSIQGTLLGLGRARVVALTSLLGLAAGALVAWALRSQGLWAVASFGAVASGVSLLTKAAWLHGRVLQRVRFGEVLCASVLVFGLGWALHRSEWAALLGPGLLRCLVALGLASLLILGIGALWDSLLSRRSDRDSLISILLQRWHRRA